MPAPAPVMVFANDAHGRSRQQQNAQPPRFAGTPKHLDRFIVELLCSIVVAVQRGDVAEDEEWAGPARRRRHRHCAASRASRRARATAWLIVAAFEGDKALNEKRDATRPMRHRPRGPATAPRQYGASASIPWK